MGGDGSWTAKDRAITLAHTMYEAMICGECGHQLSVCRDPGKAFEVTPGICQARAAIDRHQRDQKGDPEPGQVLGTKVVETTTNYGRNPFLD